MTMRSVAEAAVRNKRVLVRVDFNVPLRDGDILDDTRIRAALPTIRDLIDRGASVVLLTHLGRPKGKVDAKFSVAPVAVRLRELLGQPVATVDAVTGPAAEHAAAALKPGEVLLLENTRFDPGEEANDPNLAEAFSRLGDLYVNDAFGAAHRAHASTAGVANMLPAYAGFLLLQEEAVLSRLLREPERPFVAILGGAKVSDKLAVLGQLLTRVDALLLGGGMANTVLMALGHNIGASLAEPDLLDEGRQLLATAEERGIRLMLPTDVVVASTIDSVITHVVLPDGVSSGQAIFDIGPGTVQTYCDQIARARTIFWNGPMGVFEQPQFASGTLEIARCMAAANAFTVVGGGDSIAAVEAAGVADQIDHISTGGGASLELLEGRTLPGIAAIPQT